VVCFYQAPSALAFDIVMDCFSLFKIKSYNKRLLTCTFSDCNMVVESSLEKVKLNKVKVTKVMILIRL
jgi:hypothetical protein